MSLKISRVKDEVALKVMPTAEERAMVLQVLEGIRSRISKEAEARGLHIMVEAEGSIAKDTWIGSDKDIDVFIIFPKGTDAETVRKEGLELAKAASPGSWKMGYAEHPYVEAEVDGYTLDLVPSLEMAEGERPVTSVDRTPLHTSFVSRRLDEQMKGDVRVLKQFMKGIEVYGAELRIGGFSGYLCELLVLHFNGFEGAVKAASGWGERTVIDHMHHYADIDPGEVFDAPMVVVDPVDRRRNAAAAVSIQSYSTFIAASRGFLKSPGLRFFYPEPPRGACTEALNLLKSKGTSVLGLVLRCPQLPSDVLWGEIQKSLARIVTLLGSHDFLINGSTAWSDEKDYVVFLIEVDGRDLSPVMVHPGPKVSFAEEAERFLKKYLASDRVLAGPYVGDGRWYVELRREHTDAKALLAGELPSLKLSRDIAAVAATGYAVLLDGELEGICKEKEGLGTALLKLVRKTPAWLR